MKYDKEAHISASTSRLSTLDQFESIHGVTSHRGVAFAIKNCTEQNQSRVVAALSASVCEVKASTLQLASLRQVFRCECSVVSPSEKHSRCDCCSATKFPDCLCSDLSLTPLPNGCLEHLSLGYIHDATRSACHHGATSCSILYAKRRARCAWTVCVRNAQGVRHVGK